MRFALEGFVNTQGAVAEVDNFEHERRFGVVWPMRSHELIVHPIALPAHDWRITGLDVDRGYTVNDVSGASFTGAADAPARSIWCGIDVDKVPVRADASACGRDISPSWQL